MELDSTKEKDETIKWSMMFPLGPGILPSWKSLKILFLLRIYYYSLKGNQKQGHAGITIPQPQGLY
jgi:hypothetical protein